MLMRVCTSINAWMFFNPAMLLQRFPYPRFRPMHLLIHFQNPFDIQTTWWIIKTFKLSFLPPTFPLHILLWFPNSQPHPHADSPVPFAALTVFQIEQGSLWFLFSIPTCECKAKLHYHIFSFLLSFLPNLPRCRHGDGIIGKQDWANQF